MTQTKSPYIFIINLGAHMFPPVCHTQARHSPIEFDYLEYHGLRWGEYSRRKEERLRLSRRLLPVQGSAPCS